MGEVGNEVSSSCLSFVRHWGDVISSIIVLVIVEAVVSMPAVNRSCYSNRTSSMLVAFVVLLLYS